MLNFFKFHLMAFVLMIGLQPAKVFAQTYGTLSGSVTDAATKKIVNGVNVYVKGTAKGDRTDTTGKFEIKGLKPAEYTIEITMLGYEKLIYTDIRINANQNTPLKLQQSAAMLILSCLTEPEAMKYKIQMESEKGMKERDVRASIEKAANMAREISRQRGEGDKSFESFRRQMERNAERDKKDGKI